MRNIVEYTGKYLLPGFEDYKVLYRRKKIIEILEREKAENVLEIGCGMEPLFQFMKNIRFTVVEPSDVFYDNAKVLAENEERVRCIHGFFEDTVSALSENYDMIICSGLLHEVEFPERILQAIVRCSSENTVVHINVPNANSIHRRLGKAMGMLSDVHDMSRANMVMQQHNVFDMGRLEKLLANNGLAVIEKGGYFVKPFSHAQMYEMIKKGILDDKVLDGLYRLGEELPEFGSEIFVNCRLQRK